MIKVVGVTKRYESSEPSTDPQATLNLQGWFGCQSFLEKGSMRLNVRIWTSRLQTIMILGVIVGVYVNASGGQLAGHALQANPGKPWSGVDLKVCRRHWTAFSHIDNDLIQRKRVLVILGRVLDIPVENSDKDDERQKNANQDTATPKRCRVRLHLNLARFVFRDGQRRLIVVR